MNSTDQTTTSNTAQTDETRDESTSRPAFMATPPGSTSFGTTMAGQLSAALGVPMPKERPRPRSTKPRKDVKAKQSKTTAASTTTVETSATTVAPAQVEVSVEPKTVSVEDQPVTYKSERVHCKDNLPRDVVTVICKPGTIENGGYREANQKFVERAEAEGASMVLFVHEEVVGKFINRGACLTVLDATVNIDYFACGLRLSEIFARKLEAPKDNSELMAEGTVEHDKNVWNFDKKNQRVHVAKGRLSLISGNRFAEFLRDKLQKSVHALVRPEKSMPKRIENEY